MYIRRKVFLVICAALAMTTVIAAEYPARPLRLIVASAPGGNPDINSRNRAIDLGKQIGQQVVVENRPGASGIIGYEALARATPDGYTLGYLSNLIATNPSLYEKLPYDFARDFQPLLLYLSGLNVLTVAPSLPVRSVKELIEYARANPGKLSYGTSGIGASPHLSMELFKSMTGTNILHVGYKGTQQAITDLIGGPIDLMCDNVGPLLPPVRAGRVRGLAPTALQRLPVIPHLPTIDEAGVSRLQIINLGGFA